MQIKSIQSADNTVFGTRFGPKLTRFLEQNKEVLSHENFRNISNIRNNGIDSVLELADASYNDKKMYNYKYILNLTGPVIDKKNDVMHWKDCLCQSFQDYINGKISGNVIATDNRFPVPIKDLKENTFIPIIQKFNDNFRLIDKIDEEVKQSNIIVAEFEKFKQNWMDKLKNNK